MNDAVTLTLSCRMERQIAGNRWWKQVRELMQSRTSTVEKYQV